MAIHLPGLIQHTTWQ